MKRDEIQALLAQMTVEERYRALVRVAEEKGRRVTIAVEGLRRDQRIYALRLISRGYTIGKAIWTAKQERP